MAEKEERTIRERLSENVTEGISEGFGVVASHTTQIMGDAMSSLISDVKNLTMGTFNFLKGSLETIGGFFGKTTEERQLKESEEQTSVLKSILGVFQRQEKREMAEFGPRGFSAAELLASIVTGAGMALGAAIRTIILPFEAVYLTIRGIYNSIKGLEITKLITSKFEGIRKLISSFVFGFKELLWNFTFRIQWFIRRSKVLSKIINIFSSVFGNILKVLTNSAKYVSKLPLISQFLKGVTYGFQRLFIPLQIIMSTIDFIQGWMSTEGDIVDKIKGGLMRVVHDFIELPVRLLGWITDWFLGLFDVEIEGGSAKKIMSGLMSTLSTALDIIVLPFLAIDKILKGIVSVTKSIWNFMPDIGITKDIKKGFLGLWNVISGFFSFIGNIVKILTNLFTGDISGAKSEVTNLIDNIVSVFKGFMSTFKSLFMLSPIGLAYKGIKKLWNFFTSNRDEDMTVFNSIIKNLKEVWMNIKDWFANKIKSLTSKLNPLNWFGDDKNITNNIKAKAAEPIEKTKTVVNEKIENYTKNFTENTKSYSTNILNSIHRNVTENIKQKEKIREKESVINNEKIIKTDSEKIKDVFIDNKDVVKAINSMSDKLDKSIGKINKDKKPETKQNIKVSNQTNNDTSVNNQQNNISTRNVRVREVPEENHYLGLNILNGAMI